MLACSCRWSLESVHHFMDPDQPACVYSTISCNALLGFIHCPAQLTHMSLQQPMSNWNAGHRFRQADMVRSSAQAAVLQANRSDCVTLASTLHSQLGWPQVVLHDAVVLMDRVMQTGPHFNVVSSLVSS